MSQASDPGEKILSWDGARAWRQSRRGRRVVFTNGVFDLLHRGHIDVLIAARKCGDDLVIGVNSDASVRRLKGANRPIRQQDDRAFVLAALTMVDVVVLFDQDTPLELIRALAPDVLVKGGDYTEDTVIGAADVRARGGTVVIVPLTPGHSTTATLERIGGH